MDGSSGPPEYSGGYRDRTGRWVKMQRDCVQYAPPKVDVLGNWLKITKKDEMKVSDEFKIDPPPYCTCEKFLKNIHLLNIHVSRSTHGPYYQGDVITHCPWCGNKLIEYQSNPCDDCDVIDHPGCDKCIGA